MSETEGVGHPRTKVLRRFHVVDADLGEVFRFFEDPLNLERLTPPWLSFSVRSMTDERVRLGTEIEYRLRWQIFPMRWRSRISELERDVMFADERLSGPYRSWYHRHWFQETPDGVLITDVVEYVLPFGTLGELVHALVVRRQLEAIFDYRRVAIEEVFGQATATVSEPGP